MDEQKYNLEQSIAELDKFVDLSAKETDQDTCEALAEKAKIIYEEHPESEDIAFRYAKTLVNLLFEQENVEDVLNTVNSVKQIFDRFNHSETIALQYAKALVNLSVEQKNVEERWNTANSVKQIFDRFNHSEDIALHYAKALVSLSFEQDTVTDYENTVKIIKKLAQRFRNSEEIASEYAKALLNLSIKNNTIKEYEDAVKKLRKLAEQFKNSEEIASEYAKALVNLSVEHNTIKGYGDTVKVLKKLTEQFKNSEEIAILYARALVNLSVDLGTIKEYEDTIKKLKKLAEQFKNSEGIASEYVRALANLSVEHDSLNRCEDTVKKLKKLNENFKNSEDIALGYALILAKLSDKRDTLKGYEDTVKKLKKLNEHFKNSEGIALGYTWILANLSLKRDTLKGYEDAVKKLKKLAGQFQSSERIVSAYAWILANLSVERDSLNGYEDAVKKLKKLAGQFQSSERIVSAYAWILANLSVKRDTFEDYDDTIKKLKKLVDQFKGSEDITLGYVRTLVGLSLKQNTLKGYENTVKQLKKAVDHFKDSEGIASAYVWALANLSNQKNEKQKMANIVEQILETLKFFPSVEMFNILVDILEKNPKTPLDTNNIPTTSLTKILDKLCFDTTINDRKDLLIRALKLGILSNTKYDILKDWIEHFEENQEDPNKLNRLIDIYSVVQKIKYQLGLKSEGKAENLHFGHYTKGSTLQIMLDQEKDEKNQNVFSISGKTRLYNANYMNDPEEGLVIEAMLESKKEEEIPSYFGNRNNLDPSSWFLMSFTSKTDDLTMWSQYGDDAQGVCLILREDDFSRFTSFNDVMWRRETIHLETMHQIDSTISYDLKYSPNELINKNSTLTNTVEGKESKFEKREDVPKGNIDYLYRIAYVKNIGDNFELEQTELFENSEINELKKLLNRLKREIKKDLYMQDTFYRKAVYNCIEEIRYLFKSVDYKYENELRILRYANLDPSNKEIKIDKSSGIGKLYVERENPIQIDEVIFGPKFPNPEYVTPLLKLLDNDINYKISTIKFR